MALILTGTWEQALLAATAEAAAPLSGSGYLGRTALQKILYFLQISGVPIRYRFEIYHYGPYCDRITRDVELLLADGVLKDTSPNPDKYSNYRPGDSASELLRQHQEKLAEFKATISGVVKALLPFKPDHLEILATLDYLYRQLIAGGGAGPWKDRVLSRFKEVKKDKFPSDEVSNAYDSLVSAKLVEA